MTRILPLFPTPVYSHILPCAAALNDALHAIIAKERSRTAGVDKSNVGGWQSDIDMMRWGGTAARSLADHVTVLCRRITRSIATPAPALRWQTEMWANVNGSGDSNQSHWHPGAFLSFVYYVDAGRSSRPGEKSGGELVFIDPRMPFLRMRTPDLRHRSAGGGHEEHETWVRPVTGLLVGFPSFLSHSVRPYLGEGERISIAINMSARDA